MGIFIHLSISHSVTEQEWAGVYKETLRLVDAFPFAEIARTSVRGIDTLCLVPTRERTKKDNWNPGKTRTGWNTVGDYATQRLAEDYYLSRDLVSDKRYDASAPDAMFSMLSEYLGYKWDDPRFQKCYRLWGNKTQGEPYHMFLLAVGCLIEDRLGPKAVVYGDITRGQCREAVEMANEYLDQKIAMPARCDPERLFRRVSTFPLSEAEKLRAFTYLYLGTQDAAFGKKLRTLFSEGAFDEYWRKLFGEAPVGTGAYISRQNDYLLWGFDLEKLAGYVDFSGKDGKENYEAYVNYIMDARLYLKEKDCRDLLEIDPEREQPYDVSRLFAQFIFGGAKNRKVDRYIPLEEIRTALAHTVGDKCDVNGLIDSYLEKDEEYQRLKNAGFTGATEEELKKAYAHDASEVFTEAFEALTDRLEENREQYDILDAEALMQYEPGNTIEPEMDRWLRECFAFYDGLCSEEEYKELMQGTAEERCRDLAKRRNNILLRDKDWERIYGDILENPESFRRYYSMTRIKLGSDEIARLIKAFVCNDAFYRYVRDAVEAEEDELMSKTTARADDVEDM